MEEKNLIGEDQIKGRILEKESTRANFSQGSRLHLPLLLLLLIWVLTFLFFCTRYFFCTRKKLAKESPTRTKGRSTLKVQIPYPIF